MSLLQDPDFIILRLRQRYLQHMRDGVGERLITINPAPLNLPAYKNAGWTLAPEIKRCHSPPIPTTGAGGEYFAPVTRPVVDLDDGMSIATKAFTGLAEDGAMGSRWSEDSPELGGRIKENGALVGGVKSATTGRPLEPVDDDSSDMSEDSDEEETSNAMDRVQKQLQFEFPKKEISAVHRPRAGSSPIRNGPQVLVTSPSFSRPRKGRVRGGSHGDVEYGGKVSTTADVESLPSADEKLLSSGLAARKVREHAEITNRMRSSPNGSLPHDNGFDSDNDGDSDASSTMSSDYINTADSNPGLGIGNSLSPPIRTVAPKTPAVLHALPPPIRPVSQVQPISLLSQMLKQKASEVENPLEEFRLFSGQGELQAIYVKLILPWAPSASPYSIVVSRFFKDSGKTRETTVAETIGFAIYQYFEDKKAPKLKDEQCDINRFVLRMVDDGEPDDDFPPLERKQPLMSYMTSNQGRGRLGARREVKLEGEFALCMASEDQYRENCAITPSRVRERKPSAAATLAAPAPTPPSLNNPIQLDSGTSIVSGMQGSAIPGPLPGVSGVPTLGPSARQAAADAAFRPATSTPKTGPSKILRVHISTIDEFAQSISVCVTTDTYIGEVLEMVCKKKHLDKTKFILRISGAPSVLAPLDRTVVSLGERAELDLVRRRFAPSDSPLGDRPGSPSTNASPAAPLFPAAQAAPAKSTPKSKQKFLQGPSAIWTPDMLSSRDYLKFTVWRRAATGFSFMSRHEKVLAIDGEYVHIMPSDGKTLLNFDSQGKTRSIHISTIIGVKTYRRQPSCFKLLVMRQDKETKRYDFEAGGEEAARECVEALRNAMQMWRMDHDGPGGRLG